MSPHAPLPPEEERPAPRVDLQLERVVDRLQTLDADGSRFGQVLRGTLDELLDGHRTGRYVETELRKTEKKYVGALVEINLHRAFDFDDGIATDYRIAGIDVECRFSLIFGGWEIPPEAHGHLCLVVCADDTQSRWSASVVRIREEFLLDSQNRAGERCLNDAGLAHAVWLHRDAALPENLLLHLPPNVRAAVFSHRSGQSRVDELFRLVHGRIVPRTAVLTVAQQKDAPKRVRDARKHLRAEGTVILGHQGDHPRIAGALGLPTPRKGEWVAVRLTESSDPDPRSVSIERRRFRVANIHDVPTIAPILDVHAEDAHDDEGR